MTFLDEAPLQLSRREVIELRDLFLSAYYRYDPAETLAYEAGLALGSFPINSGDMRTTWTLLLPKLANQGKLRRLVELASADPTASAYQSRFAEMLSANPPVKAPEPPLPPGSWKGDDLQPAQAANLFQERLLEKRSRMLHIGVLRRMGELARSVAKLDMSFSSGERTHGTGFLIQPDLLLSNHHNFVAPQLGNLVSVSADFDDERDFNSQRLVVKGLVETVKGNEAHDWAVIQLATVVDRPPLALGSPFDVQVNDALIIIQHPLGAAKQFSLDGMAVRFVDDNVVQYVADTQKGSSGSPVFSAAMHVVALHHAETEVVVDVSGVKETAFRNQGIHMKQVTQALTQAAIPFIAQTA